MLYSKAYITLLNVYNTTQKMWQRKQTKMTTKTETKISLSEIESMIAEERESLIEADLLIGTNHAEIVGMMKLLNKLKSK